MLVVGPDAAYFAGIAEKVAEQGRLAMTGTSYEGWGGLFLLSVSLAQVGSFSLNQSALILVLLFGVGASLCCAAYCSREACPKTYVHYLIPPLYFMAFQNFMNWQFAPQTAALALTISIFLLISRNIFQRRWMLMFLLVFSSLVIFHPFFWSLYIIGAVCMLLLETWKKMRMGIRPRILGWGLLPALVIATAYVFMTENASYIVRAHRGWVLFGGLQRFFLMFGRGTTFSTASPAPLYVVLAYVSGFSQLIVISAMALSILYRLWRRSL
jgi:hypothetical protein